MTVRDNVVAPRRPARRQVVERALEAAGLARKARHPGRRAGAGRAAPPRDRPRSGALARLVLMDEPTAGLNPEETDALVELIADAVRARRRPDPDRAQARRRRRPLPDGDPARPGPQGCRSAAGGAVCRRRLPPRLSRGYGWIGRSPSMRMTFAILAIAAGLGAACRRSPPIVRAPPSPASRRREKFAYDCTFKLTNARTGAPLEQAQVTHRRRHALDADGAQRAAGHGDADRRPRRVPGAPRRWRCTATGPCGSGWRAPSGTRSSRS